MADNEVVHIAYCPEHGLHGDRTECFVCNKPVQQLPMIHVSALIDQVQRTVEATTALNVALTAMYEARRNLTPGMRAGTAEACDVLDRAHTKIKQRLEQAGLV